MKHLKYFENINNKQPKIGQYVLLHEDLWKGKSEYKEHDDFVNFINNNIGVIKNRLYSYGLIIYLVEYENMPYDIDMWLQVHGGRDETFDLENRYQRQTYKFTNRHKNYIVGDTIEEIEIKKNTNKFGL